MPYFGIVIVFYVYNKNIVTLKHRSTKFKCVKKIYSQISYMIRIADMIFDQIAFYKINKSKICHLKNIIQIPPNFICSNYKLSMVAFDNIH